MCFFLAPVAAVGAAGAAAAGAAGAAAAGTAVAATAGTAAATAASASLVAAGEGALVAAGLSTAATAATAGATTAGSILGDIALASTVVGGLGSIVSSSVGAAQQKQASEYNAKASKVAALAEEEAASRRAGIIARDTSLAVSAQRAAFGGTGFDVNTGDPVTVIRDTLNRGATDAAAEFVQGQRRAAAYRSEAENDRIAGKSAVNQGIGSGFGTVLATGGRVADVWYRFNR